MSVEKEYTGTIKLGVTTNTQDAEGAILTTMPVPALTEDGVVPRGLAVPPQAVQALAEVALDRGEQAIEPGRFLVASDQHELRALARALHDDLQVADAAGVGGVGIGKNALFDQGAPDHPRDLIDERVMHATIRDVHDPMTAELEDADLRVLHATANGEARAVTKAEARAFGHPRRGQAVSFESSGKYALNNV